MNTEHSYAYTYKKIYYKIIDPIFDAICNSESNKYCLKTNVDSEPIQYAIRSKFLDYMNMTQNSMKEHGKPDRHKLASCLCGAIVKVQPLCRYDHNKDQINEIAAMYTGLRVVEFKCDILL